MLLTLLPTRLLMTAMAIALPASSQSQERAEASGSVGGLVIDATAGLPLSAVLVTLEPVPGGLLVSAGRALLASSRTMETDGRGAYRFDDVAPGRYRIRVERLGYRSAVVEVDVRRPMDARVSVGLQLEPVVLEAVHVREQAEPPFRRAAAQPDEPEAARMMLERERQSLFVATDSRALTYADLVDGVTLGETDIFRALQRFPGVSTRDDYTAELWTRGAPWAQTRVTFDGQPLFNPVHAVGVFSAVTPDILGAVFFHPGHRSVSMGEGAAGVVDLRTRPGSGKGELSGALDVSMASARLELDQRVGSAAWIVSARRSYLDVLNGSLEWLGLNELDLPYAFHDLSARFDVQLSDRHSLEASGLWEDDRLFGDVEGILERTHANWGNAVGRVTLNSPFGPWRARHTVGLSRYRSHVQESGDTLSDGRPIPWSEPPADNRVTHARLVAEVEPVSRAGQVAAWGVGYEIVHQSMYYDGPEPRFHPVRPDTTVRIHREAEAWSAAGWLETRLHAGQHFTLLPGLRVEGGTGIADGGKIRFAPRLAARLNAGAQFSVSASASRAWQYLQSIALAGPSAHPAFHASHFWLLANDSAPAIRSDLFTVGAEQWLGRGWLASVSAYHRHSSGVAMPDPATGPIAGRPLYVEGENTAHGLELGVRRVAGRWTASFGYTLSKSENTAAHLTFPASTDRRHRVDASTIVQLPAGLRAGVAYSGMTGSPYTRVQGRIRAQDCSNFGFECQAYSPSTQEANALRTPDYQSVDAILMVTRPLGRVHVSAYLQLRNVLDRDNAVTYIGSVYRVIPATRPRDTNTLVWEDRFEQGLPRLPLFGARISF